MDHTRPTMFLVASRIYKEGQSMLHLVCPSNGFYRYVPESILSNYGINLGDFAHATLNRQSNQLEEFRKTQHTANLTVAINGNLAQVENIKAKLEELPSGQRVYQNKLFPNAYCGSNDIPLGLYTIKVTAMHSPQRIDGKTIAFQGVCPLRCDSPKPSAPVVGAGFAQSGKKITGAGFERESKEEKLKAVVLNTKEGHGKQTHYLWILGANSECQFSQPDYKLEKGHVFEGNFVKLANGFFKFKSYGKQVSGIISGGLDDKNRSWFNVAILNCKPKSFNDKYRRAETEHFGQVLDVDNQLPEDCEGQMVKIQRRRGAGDNEYYWMII